MLEKQAEDPTKIAATIWTPLCRTTEMSMELKANGSTSQRYIP